MARNPEVEVTARLRPQAAPVQAYVRPQEPARSPLFQVAQALDGFDRDLSGFLAERRQKDDALDRIRGEAAFYQNNQAGYAEAVRSGSIPSFASPAFVEAYKAAEGAVAGEKLSQDLQADYLKWPGKDAATAGDFDAFFNGAVRGRIGSQDPYVLKGLLPKLRGISEGLRGQFTRDLSRSTYNSSAQAHGAMSSQAIDGADTAGLGSQTGTDYEGLWGRLVGIRQTAVGSGLRAEDADEQLVSAITAKAVELRDPKLLSLLDRKLPGQTYAISDTEAGRKAKIGAASDLETLARRSEADAERQAAVKDKAAKKALTERTLDALAADPTKPIAEADLAAGSKIDPEYRLRVLEWQRKLAEGGVREDPNAITEVYRSVLGGGGTRAVERALQSGTIRDHRTLKEAVGFARSLEEAGGGNARIFKGATYSGVMSAIKSRTLADGIANPWEAEGLSDAGLAAQTDYQRLLLAWHAKNPAASEDEVLKAQSDIGKLIVEGIKPAGETQDGRAVYTRPEGSAEAVGPNAFAPPAPRTPAEPPTEAQDDPAALKAFVDGLTSEQRSQVENAAKTRAVDPNELYRRLMKRRPQASADPVSAAPEEAVGAQFSDIIQASYSPDAELPSGRKLGEVRGETTPVTLAESFLGKSEGADAEVLSAAFRKMAGVNIDPRSTAWCAAFVNAALGGSGVKGTGSLMARSFLNFGRPVEDPSLGDIVVFSRGSNKAQGHVGFFYGWEERGGQRYVRVLGGNQGNRVSIRAYPASRLLGVRRPPTAVGSQIDTA